MTELLLTLLANSRVAFLFLAIAGTVPGRAAGQASEASITLFLEAHCLECHDAETAKGEVILEGLAPDFADVANAETWNRIMEQVAFGEMPPKERKRRPDAGESTGVVDWIEARLRKAGYSADLRQKMQSPAYGNYVNHEQLFDGSVKSGGYTPSRLWKRGPHHFESLLIRGIGLGEGNNGRPNGNLTTVKQPFSIEERAGIVDYAAITFADSATLGTLLRNAEVIVDKHLGGAIQELEVRRHGEVPEDQWPKDKKGNPIRPRFPRTVAEFADIVLSEALPDDGALDAAVRKMFALAVERGPSDAEFRKYRGFLRQCIVEGGNVEGLRVGLVAIAICPEAIYRSELGQGEKDAEGRQYLGPADLAFAVSYALTDGKPDAILREAAERGGLLSREDVIREATRLWDDDAIEKPRILRFFHEFFGYHTAPKVFKDAARFPGDFRGVPERLVEDADVLVRHIVKQDREVLARLLTTEEYFVAHSGDNAEERQANAELRQFFEYFKDKGWADFPYATPEEHARYARSIGRRFAHPNGNVVKGWMKYLSRCDENGVSPMPLLNGRDYVKAYDLDEQSFDYPVDQPFVLAKGKRAGILMHPAWLLAHSLNLDNDPVRRGKWIRERLLAGTVPEIPITVDARIPEDPHLSLRERFLVVREDKYCWRCHVRMNPLGMPFETFDDFGRHRGGFELLQAKGESKAVDSGGLLDGTGDSDLDGEVGEPIEMLRRLARSERVRQSFVRHAFRYWMGRNETPSDSATLIAADKAYVANNGSFRALVISLLSSDSFLYRKSED